MRGFLVFLLLAGFGYLVFIQKQNETSQAPASPGAAASVAVKTTPAPLTPAPRGQASEYNYMKRALDRAADVRDDARARTSDAQDIHP